MGIKIGDPEVTSSSLVILPSFGTTIDHLFSFLFHAENIKIKADKSFETYKLKDNALNVINHLILLNIEELLI